MEYLESQLYDVELTTDEDKFKEILELEELMKGMINPLMENKKDEFGFNSLDPRSL